MTARIVSVGLWLVLLAAPASAYDFRPFMVLAGGQALDVVSTQRFLATGRCSEGNARFGAHPSSLAIIGSSALVVGGLSAIAYVSGRSSSRAIRTMGRSLAYFGGGFGAFNGVNNLRSCGW